MLSEKDLIIFDSIFKHQVLSTVSNEVEKKGANKDRNFLYPLFAQWNDLGMKFK